MQNQKVTLDFTTAINHLNNFIEIRKNEKDIFKLKLQQAEKTAVYKLLKYRSKYGIDMEKEELLRDVVFIGTSLVESSSSNFRYYKAVVKASLAIVEIETKKSFTQEFVEKMLKAMNAFQCNNGVHFSTEAFYFVFKTHFRLS